MEYTTGNLRVSIRDHGQFAVSSSHDHENWGRDYFHISGYFGSYGPHLIAAAPDLYDALLRMVEIYDIGEMTDVPELDDAITALSKARGETQ